MKENKKIIILVLSILIITILISINYAYSFYRGKIKEENKTETVLKSKKIALVFDDTKEVKVLDMLPGKSVDKTFTVTSDADKTLKYNIKFKDIVKTYENDMVYTLKCNGETLVKETPLPITNKEEYILENIEINPKEKKEYTLTITYKNLEDKLQEINSSNTFSGTVEIDLEEEQEALIKTYDNQKTITDEEIKNNKEVIKEFRVRNADASKKIKYNINLANLINTYEKEELSYTLEKNGEVIANNNVAKEGELTYLNYNQELLSGETDKYKLTIKNNKKTEEEKKFNADIEIDTKEVTDSKPEALITLENKTTNSITVNASCIDTLSGIKKYSFYKDNELVKEIETKEKSYKYTYANLNENEYELKLVCTNNFDVISDSKIKEIPNILVIPTIEKNDNYEREKKVIVKYPGEGNKYVIITGSVTSNKELKECNEKLECSETLPVGSTLKENTIYKTEEDLELTYKTNGTIKAKVNDTVNEKETEEIEIINVDNEKPTVTFETNGNSIYQKTQSTKVTVTDNLSGVSTLKYQWTNSTNQPAVSTFTNTFASGDTLTKSDGTGDYYLWILAIDNAGNQIITKSNIFKLDNINPTCTIDVTPTSWNNSATLKITGTDGHSGISSYSFDGETYNSTSTKIINENNTYTAYTKDKAGNIGKCSKEVTNIDTTKPIATIKTKTKTSKSITVTGTCTDNESGIKRYEFYLDGTKKATYDIKDNAKDYTYENVKSGNHTYKLVCTNNASLTGEISGTETPNELEIPTYTVASGYAKSKTTTITYKGEGAYLLKTTGSATSNIELIDCGETSNNGEYTCSTTTLPVGSSLKENTWYKAVNNPTLTYTSNGTLIAKTADGINYKQGSSLTISGVDNTSPTKPNVTLKLNNASGSAYTSGTWTNNSVYVELSSTDTGSGIDHYEWYESGWTTRAMTTTGGVTSVTYTAERNETVRFRAIDKAGNISEETSAVIKIDKTKPTCTNSGDSTTWTSGNRTITWGCSDTLSGCKTGYTGGSQTYTTSTKTVTIASYTIKDNAGNETTCPQRTADVYVDKTAPTCSISGNPTSYTNNNVILTVTGTDAHSGGVTYSWDGTNYSSTQTKTVTENGTYKAYTKDTLGNTANCSVNVTKIDKTKPTVTFGTNGNSTYAKSQSTKVTVTDNLSGTNTLKYQWTTSTTAPAASTFTTSFTNGSTITKSDGTGSYYLWILATDNAGNQAITRSNVFNLDNTAPTCSISGNPTDWTQSATLTATGSDSHSGLSSVVFTGTTSASKTVTSNGSVSATVTDKAGNTNTCSANVTKIDTEKPTCTITGLPTSWTTNATLTVNGTDNESGISGYSWDGTNYSTTKTKSITANGTYTAYVKDKAGNIKNCSATITKIDAVSPTAPVITGGTGQWQSYNQVVWNTTDSTAASGIKKYQYCINSSNTTTGCSWSDLYNNTDKNPNDTAIDGMDVAFYHQSNVDLINAFKGNVHSLYSHYLSNGKAEGRSISCTGSCSWIRNAQNISKNGESYVFFRAISNSGLTSSASNSIHLKIDTVIPTVTFTKTAENINSTALVYSTTYGQSGGSTSCINASNNNKTVTTFNSIGILGPSTITCTAKSNAGLSATITSNITINGTFQAGNKLYSLSPAYQSGTSIIIPNGGTQYGPYMPVKKGCYIVSIHGTNLDKCPSCYHVYESNSTGVISEPQTLNYINTNATYYVIASQNTSGSGLETVIINNSNYQITVDSIEIVYRGSSC